MDNNQKSKQSNGLVYVLVAIIIALLGITLYSVSQKKKMEKEYVYLTETRAKLQLEVGRLESDLKQANSTITSMTVEMKQKQVSFQKQIILLKQKLNSGNPKLVADLQRDLAALKGRIAGYLAEIAELRKQNQLLTVERDSLQTTVVKVTEKVGTLEKVNVDLTDKNITLTKAAAALKATNIIVQTLKVKNSGKEVVVKKAKKTKKVKLDFKVHQNNFAQTGTHDVYIQILDAARNVLEGQAGGVFTIDGKEMLYTHKAGIDFNNDERDYTLDWINTQPFIPGDYSIVLYSDGYIMGQAKFTLK